MSHLDELDEFEAELELARRRHDRVELVQRPHASTRRVVRVLEGEHAHALVCDLRARLGRHADLLGRQPAAVARKPERHEPGVCRSAAVFVDDHVRGLLGDEHVARPAVQLQCDLVGHRRRRKVDRLLLPEQPRYTLLQLVDGRVLALLLVADDRSCDRGAHPRGRARRSVGTQVDHRREATLNAWI